MDIEDKVYYRSDVVTVTRSALVIQPYTGRPAWMDWVLGHPGEQTLAMQSVCSITIPGLPRCARSSSSGSAHC